MSVSEMTPESLPDRCAPDMATAGTEPDMLPMNGEGGLPTIALPIGD